MARPIKMCLDWAPWDTNIFEKDDKIFLLLAEQGWKGFGIYFYICQQIYGTGGYSMEWAVPLSACRVAQKAGGGIGHKAVQEIISNCLRIGLFDQGLYDRWQILTSRAIQIRYAKALKDRSANAKRVISEYWLLTDAENDECCPGLVKVTLEDGFPEENGGFPEENAGFPLLDKIRLDDINTNTNAPTRERVEEYFAEHGCTDPAEVDAFMLYNEERGWRVAANWQYYAERFIGYSRQRHEARPVMPKKTTGKKNGTTGAKSSFDVQAFFQRALDRSYNAGGDDD